jgi:hypothetical protein
MGHIDHPYNVIADAGQSTCRSQQPNSDKYIYQDFRFNVLKKKNQLCYFVVYKSLDFMNNKSNLIGQYLCICQIFFLEMLDKVTWEFSTKKNGEILSFCYIKKRINKM